MVNIKAEKIDIEKEQLVADGWYSFADFCLSERKKVLGIFTKKVVYAGDAILLMVCSSNLKGKPADPNITNEEFTKRLALDKFNEQEIHEYIEEKVHEASSKSSMDEAYTYLKQFFVVDDYVPQADISERKPS